MDLWIRSQDKETLIKTELVMMEEIEKDKEYWIYLGHENYEPYRCLGVYHSKERALEVLDEIHQRLIDLQTLEIAMNVFTKNRSLDCVYVMPEE